MKPKPITITIEGGAKTGKSGLAFAIAHCLQHLYEIPCRVNDDNGCEIIDEPEKVMLKSFPSRMGALAKRQTLVVIQTQMSKRNTK